MQNADCRMVPCSPSSTSSLNCHLLPLSVMKRRNSAIHSHLGTPPWKDGQGPNRRTSGMARRAWRKTAGKRVSTTHIRSLLGNWYGDSGALQTCGTPTISLPQHSNRLVRGWMLNKGQRPSIEPEKFNSSKTQLMDFPRFGPGPCVRRGAKLCRVPRCDWPPSTPQQRRATRCTQYPTSRILHRGGTGLAERNGIC